MTTSTPRLSVAESRVCMSCFTTTVAVAVAVAVSVSVSVAVAVAV